MLNIKKSYFLHTLVGACLSKEHCFFADSICPDLFHFLTIKIRVNVQKLL